MLDSFGREIRYLRVSVTDKCNLSCTYCKPRPVKTLRHEDMLSIEELVSVVRAFCRLGVDKVRVTGGEPLLRKGVVAFCEQVAALGCETVMTTNATRLREFAPALRRAGVSRINVSLDTMDAEAYRAITGGDISAALEGIHAAREEGFPLRINAVLQKGVNEDIMPLVDFSESVGAELRFIELMPFNSTTEYFAEKFVPSERVIEGYGMTRLSREGVAEYYGFDGHRVGFISPLGHKFCDGCERMRLTGTGKILPCLHSSLRFDVRPYLGDEERLVSFLAECIKAKPHSHHLEEGELQSEDMGSIGG